MNCNSEGLSDNGWFSGINDKSSSVTVTTASKVIAEAQNEPVNASPDFVAANQDGSTKSER